MHPAHSKVYMTGELPTLIFLVNQLLSLLVPTHYFQSKNLYVYVFLTFLSFVYYIHISFLYYSLAVLITLNLFQSAAFFYFFYTSLILLRFVFMIFDILVFPLIKTKTKTCIFIKWLIVWSKRQPKHG